VQLLAEAQETPVSWMLAIPQYELEMTGVGWIVHPLPALGGG